MADTDDQPPRPRARRPSGGARRSSARAKKAPPAEPAVPPPEPVAPTPEPVAPPPAPAAPLPDSAPPSEARRLPWREIASWLLAVLASVAIAASVLAVWVHETMLDTDRFMEVVAPAVESEAVQAAAGEYLSNQLIAALDLTDRLEAALASIDDRLGEGVAEALDLTDEQFARLQALDINLTRLAGPIAAGVESRIRDGVSEIVAQPAMTSLLLSVTEAAHEKTVHLVRGELDQLPNLVIEEGQVRLNLVPLIAEALRSLVRAGFEIVGLDVEIPRIAANVEPGAAIERLASALGRELDPDFGQVAVMSEERLQELQDLVRTVDLLVWALVLVTLGLAAAAVFTAPSIGAGVIRVAIGGAIGIVVGILIVNGITEGLAEAIESGTARGAFEAIMETIVGSLQPVAIALAIVGFAAAATAYVATRRST
jgi:hypothetical protein